MAVLTRIQNNQITDGTIVATSKLATGSITGNLLAPSVTFNSNITILGNLTVANSYTQLNSVNTYINDPLVVFNNGYTGSPSYDIGMLMNRNLQPLTGYNGESVNVAWIWEESSNQFQGILTTETGTTTGVINNSGYANLRIGNVVAQSQSIGSLAVTESTALNLATVNGLQAQVIGNVTPGIATFTNANITALQAVAIGNVTPGTAVFTTANLTVANISSSQLSSSPTTGALTVAGGVGIGGPVYLNQGLNFYNLSNNALEWPYGSYLSEDGTTALLTVSGKGGINLQALDGGSGPGNANVTLSNGNTGVSSVFDYTGLFTIPRVSTGGLQAKAIGNVTPGTGAFTTINTSGNIVASSATGSLTIWGNALSSNTGVIGLGSISNVGITGGSSGYAVTTNGQGVLSFSAANVIVLGANASGQLVSNAVSLTSTTDVTDAIAQLNAILGKLTPSSPPNFPATTLTQSTGTISGLMTNFVQTDNSGWGNLSVAGGTSVSVVRSAVLATSTVTNSGTTPSGGNIQLAINGTIWPNNYHALTASPTSADNGTYGNLVVSGVQDYHNIVSTVAAGFWNVFSASVAATSIPAGWNRLNITYTGDGAATGYLTWYYDASSPTAPAFSGTSMVLSSNVVSYSSTIPHLNSSAGFTLNGTVQNLSGDLYYANWTSTAANFFSGTGSGGALLAPANRTLAQVGVPLPLTRSNTTAYSFSTTANVTTGFGSATATTGPTLNVSTPYATTGSGTFQPGNIILYKTGTGTQIEETSLTSSYGSTYRIVNPDGGTAADTPAYTGSEAAFNSQTSTLLATDATVVAAKLQYDVTNYSSGYYPVGPNLSSGRASSQYFTFKFTYAALASFYIHYTGTLAGLWIACPGVTDTPASPTNGWLNAAVAYAGSGVPGTGTGGNGSNGCAVGGNATLNSNGTYDINVTFGSVNTSSAGNKSNEVYVRVKLTSGQSLTVLNVQAS
jgi:hypothetical protein